MTVAERAAVIEALHRRHAEAIQRQQRMQARHEAIQAAITQVTELYIDAITVPLRAFAEELRR